MYSHTSTLSGIDILYTITLFCSSFYQIQFFLYCYIFKKEIQLVENRMHCVWNVHRAVSVFGYNRRCADFFLDPMYDHCSNAYDRFYLFLLRH